MKSVKAVVACALFAFVLSQMRADPRAAGAANGTVALSAGTTYSQNFDALASSGASGTLPTGWAFEETNTNQNSLYTAATGSSATGDTYSFGSTGSTDRAFGTLLSGNLTPTIGASFTNSTGATIDAINISYTGEQWRYGGPTSRVGLADRLDFQYSTTATALTVGSFTNVDPLDFVGLITAGTAGPLDGNAGANRRTITATIAGLNIPNGATFWIRWSDFNVTGSDDGLAVDDFSLTPHTLAPVPTNPSVTATVSPNTASAGEPLLFTATPVAGQNPASTGLAVSINLSAIGGAATQTMYDNGTHGDPTANDGIFSLAATIASGTTAGLKNLGLTVTDSLSRSGSGAVSLTVLAPPTITPIHAIQGTRTTSTMTGLTVTTEGIVIGVKSNGFFMQLPDVEADLDANTSEGLFVFTTAAGLPTATAVGNRVRVTGQVSEFKSTTTDPDGLSVTELTGPSVIVLSTGNPLPTPITLTGADLNPGASIFALEKYEGMRIRAAQVIATAPTGGNVSEANASSTSNGLFFAVLPGTPRPFREPGLQTPLPVPAEAAPGAAPPIWDGNPERIGVDTDAIAGTAAEAAAAPPAGTALDVTTGVTVDNVIGPLDYAFRSYIIDAERWNPPVATTPNASFGTVRPRNDDEFTVATFNMERFFDTTNDAGVSDVQLTSAAFERRLSKASLAIRNVLLMPDVIGVEEMENLTTLQAVATRVSYDAIMAGQGDPHYVAYLSEGNDVGGIDNGLLVRGDRLDVDRVTQYGKDTLFLQPDGQTALLNDRPPLVLRADVRNAPFDPYAVTVIVNHMRSLSGVDGPDGLRIRTKRRVQAEYLATLIQSFQTVSTGHPVAERVISVGDYNAFDINDGYVDSIGTVKGTPTPANQVTQASPDLVDPDLIDLVSLAPAAERYSFTFDGNAQELDHLLVTTGPSNAVLVNGVNYGRINGDFPEIYRNDAARPERISDHDPIVGYFSLPDLDVTPPNLTVPASFSLEGDTVGGAIATYTATAIDGVDGSVTPVCDRPAGSLFPVGATLVTCTATDAHGNIATATFTITVTDTTAPVLSLPPLLTVEAEGPGGAAVAFSVTAFDIVSGSLTPSCSAVSGATFPLGAVTVTCRATDAAGNTASGSFGVNVVDTTPPELTVPAPIVIEATGASGATVVYAASALDAVDGSVMPTCGPLSGSTFAIGITLASCTVTDAHNNPATRTFTVEVRDTAPPDLTVPAPIVSEATSASGATVVYAASALDVVDGSVTPSCDPPSGSTFAIGSTRVTCTATDAHGNPATRTFTIEVRDTTPPAIASVSTTPSVVWPPDKRMVPVAIVVSATDAVSVPACRLTGITGDDGSTSADRQITGGLTALVRADRTGGGAGRTYTLAFTCTDAAGNASGSAATVVVPHDRRK